MYGISQAKLFAGRLLGFLCRGRDGQRCDRAPQVHHGSPPESLEEVTLNRLVQGLLFWLFKGGFKVSSGPVDWYISSSDTDFDSSEIASPVVRPTYSCSAPDSMLLSAGCRHHCSSCINPPSHVATRPRSPKPEILAG